MGRTVTGRGRITKLYTCNKMCWFKIGLEINPTKPGKTSLRAEPKMPLKPYEGGKKKKKNPQGKKKKKNPQHYFSQVNRCHLKMASESFWSNMCTAIFHLMLLKQWKIEKKLEEVPSSDWFFFSKNQFITKLCCASEAVGTWLCNKVWNMLLYACKHLHAHTHRYWSQVIFSECLTQQSFSWGKLFISLRW